jgi:hypothetical protein
VVKGGQEQGA